MSVTDEFKLCPFCKEQIRATALKCRFCGEWLEQPPPPDKEFTSGDGAEGDNKPDALLEPLQLNQNLMSQTEKPPAKASEQNEKTSERPPPKYGQTEKRLVELKKSIQEVNPNWHPPTLADRILIFIKSKGKATIDEVVKEFSGSASPFLTKNVLKKKTDTLWTAKDGKFSAVVT
jgi:hypothetical protein